MQDQIGQESTPQQYIDQLKLVFQQVYRVLEHDGTLWLNLGDIFLRKQLLLIPARVALALQDDGWIIRQHIVWSKPAPMPEQVVDRPTSAWESVFLLTKSKWYYYDADAIRDYGNNDKSKRLQNGVDDVGESIKAKVRMYIMEEESLLSILQIRLVEMREMFGPFLLVALKEVITHRCLRFL